MTASATDPAGSNDTSTYAYQIYKNGSSFAAGSGVNQTSFNFTPDDNGSYDIQLTVSDEDGGSATTSQTISVANANPVPSIDFISSTRIEGTSIAVTASGTDPAGSTTR